MQDTAPSPRSTCATWGFVAASALLLTASDCQNATGPNPEPEAIDFYYAFVPATQNGYTIRRSINGNCDPVTEEAATLAQITAMMRSGIRDHLANCAELWSMNTIELQESRDNYVAHEARFVGGDNISIRHALTQSRGATAPFRVVLQTLGGAPVGQRTTNGDFRVELGSAGGPAFFCEQGGANWDAAGPDATFFEVQLSRRDQNRGVITGDFQCIARSIDDPNDTRLLLVLEGGFHLRAR